MFLWLHLLPLRPFARIHHGRVKQPIRAGGESNGVSCFPPPRMRELGADAMADLSTSAEQPSNEKTTAYKYKKTEEDQWKAS